MYTILADSFRPELNRLVTYIIGVYSNPDEAIEVLNVHRNLDSKAKSYYYLIKCKSIEYKRLINDKDEIIDIDEKILFM